MKTTILISALLFGACSTKDHCLNDASIAAFAHEEALQHFPVPKEVKFNMDTVIVNDHGNKVVRGRVLYRNALAQAVEWPKYWIAVDCTEGKATLLWLDVDHGGPEWRPINP